MAWLTSPPSQAWNENWCWVSVFFWLLRLKPCEVLFYLFFKALFSIMPDSSFDALPYVGEFEFACKSSNEINPFWEMASDDLLWGYLSTSSRDAIAVPRRLRCSISWIEVCWFALCYISGRLPLPAVFERFLFSKPTELNDDVWLPFSVIRVDCECDTVAILAHSTL